MRKDDNGFFGAVDEHIQLFNSLSSLKEEIGVAEAMMSSALRSGNKIMFCGNGGSASDAQHLAAELVGRFCENRRALPAISLAADSSALTCISNDFGYENVFARQIEGLGNPGDVLVAISTSGRSVNVVRAVEVANSADIGVISLTGADNSQIKDFCIANIAVPAINTARIQEAHIFIGHFLCGQLEKSLGLVE